MAHTDMHLTCGSTGLLAFDGGSKDFRRQSMLCKASGSSMPPIAAEIPSLT